MHYLFNQISYFFGLFIRFFYFLTGSYGVSIILFGFAVSSFLYPLQKRKQVKSFKEKRLEPYVTKIRAAYPNDDKTQTALMSKMYELEKVNLLGGFFLSILPFLFIFPLFHIALYPVTFLLGAPASVVAQIRETLGCGNISEIELGALIAENSALLTEIPGITNTILRGIQPIFLGIELDTNALYQITHFTVSWGCIGPIVFAICELLFPYAVAFISKAIAARKAGSQAVSKDQRGIPIKISILSLLLLIFSAFVSFTLPFALCLYLFSQSILDTYWNAKIKKAIANVPPISFEYDDLIKEYEANKVGEALAEEVTDTSNVLKKTKNN